jgi:hypothetical protein
MTKYKELHRAVQHLTDFQMNGPVRRVAEYQTAGRGRKYATWRIDNGRIPIGRTAGVAPPHARQTLSPLWLPRNDPLPPPSDGAADLPSRRP